MTSAEIHRGIEELGPWFYPFEFAGGLRTTPVIPQSVVDIFDTRLQMLMGVVDAHFGERLRDIDCLDIGCHEGFYSLAMARTRGVRNVVGVDARPGKPGARALRGQSHGSRFDRLSPGVCRDAGGRPVPHL